VRSRSGVLRAAVPEPWAGRGCLTWRKLGCAWTVRDTSLTGSTNARMAFQLVGPDPTAQVDVATSSASQLNLSLAVISAGDLPKTAPELDRMARIWTRDRSLGALALLLDCTDLDAAEPTGITTLRRFVDRLEGLVFVAAPSRLPLGGSTFVMNVGRPSAPEQYQLWLTALGTSGQEPLDAHIERLVGQFDFGASDIEIICREALSSIDSEPTDLGATLQQRARIRSRPRADELTQRIESRATWNDIVLPDSCTEVLHQIAAHARTRYRVYNAWGFAQRTSRGLGISALFAGPSGTGKTMAAEVLANELQLDLYRIDLATTFSKYIGETEKHLRGVFDAAEAGGAILLFDEADALFGKRTEVKDSHDRYANVEVSYLLQRMEEYRGLAVLTTNREEALDQAFLRRLRFIVRFPFPSAVEREALWRGVFPATTPLDGVDPVRLAGLNIAGGTIRNIALIAAAMAADEGCPVRPRHILRATRTEYAKLKQPLTEAELRFLR
jgi:ATPase family protein associated with various cellular activities (AAA)